MSDRHRHAAGALSRASQQLRIGDPAGAVESLRAGLSLLPEDAALHAVLALALLRLRRRHAARTEARLAVGQAPDLPLAHHALGLAHLAFRDLRAAEASLRQAVALAPGDDTSHAALGQALQAAGRRDEAEAAFSQALAIEPADPSHLAAMGDLELSRGRWAEARRLAQEALGYQPDHAGALVLMGHVLLADGDVEGAREHALLVLRREAASLEALHLLTAAKARQSHLLGLWWRFSTMMSRFGRGTVLALLGMFVAYRLAVIALQEAGVPEGARLAQWAWMGFAIYTWVAPGLFRRALDRELASVRLSPDF